MKIILFAIAQLLETIFSFGLNLRFVILLYVFVILSFTGLGPMTFI
jgi:hypothetical protein